MTQYTRMRGVKPSWPRPCAMTGVVASILSLLFFMNAMNAVDAADWSTYRADIARSGVTLEGPSHELALQWTYRPLQAPKPAWPLPSEELPRMHSDNAYHVAISEGLVYFGSSVTNQVLAIDAASGDVRWSFYAEGPVRFAPTVCAGRVHFGSDDGHVYCLDAADGKLLWKRRAGPSDEKVLGNGRMISLWPVRTSVLVDNGAVYFAAGVFPYEGLYVYALNAEDGSVVWVNDTIGDRASELEYGGMSPHGYLVASAQILYIPSGRAMPAAFDRASGKFLFFVSPGGKRGGTWALLDDDRLIAGVDASGTPNKAAYDAASGKRKEDAFAWFAGTDMAVTPAVVYLVNADGAYAVDRHAYASAVENAKRLDAERQELERQVAELKKKQSEQQQPAAADDLAKQLAEQEKKLDLATKQRGTTQKLCLSLALWRQTIHGSDASRRPGVGRRPRDGCRSGRVERERSVASRRRWFGCWVGRGRGKTGREHRHRLRPLLRCGRVGRHQDHRQRPRRESLSRRHADRFVPGCRSKDHRRYGHRERILPRAGLR